MKKQLLITALLFFPVVLFAQISGGTQLQTQKNQYDSLRNANGYKIEVLIRMQGDTSLYIIGDGAFPAKGIETTYNILRNTERKIVLVSTYPYSESGDWFVGFTHYFNAEGKTFAFERLTSFYNSGCTEGVAIEKTTNFYDNNFAVINTTYSLTDKKNVPLKKSKCEFPYNFNYTANKTVEEVFKQQHIPLQLINN